MKTINAKDFLGRPPEKERTVLIPARARVTVNFNPGTTTTVSLVDHDGVLHEIGTVSHSRRVREQYEINGFKAVHLGSKTKQLFDVQVYDIQVEEPHDDEPVPEKVESKNLFGRMRERAAKDMRCQREQFISDGTYGTDYQGYEIPDDDPEWFDDDIVEAMEQAEKELNATAEPEPEPVPNPAPEPPVSE